MLNFKKVKFQNSLFNFIKSFFMDQFVVDVDFIKQAHSAACLEWKKKLEDKFPVVFKKTNKQLVEDYIKSNPIYYFNDKKVLFYDHNCITLELPNSNNDWTKGVFNWIYKFIDYMTITYDITPYIDWEITTKNNYSNGNGSIVYNNYRIYVKF